MEVQRKVDEEAAQLALYYYETCRQCIRVQRTIERLRLKIEMRNIRDMPGFRKQLTQGSGQATVPCLRIRKADGEPGWIQDADEIIKYLEQRFK